MTHDPKKAFFFYLAKRHLIDERQVSYLSPIEKIIEATGQRDPWQIAEIAKAVTNGVRFSACLELLKVAPRMGSKQQFRRCIGLAQQRRLRV